MSLRSRAASSAGRDAAPKDGPRLQHVLQVGATIRTFAQPKRTYVVVKADASEMHEVLKTAIAESLELIRGREIGRDSTSIRIEAMDPNVTFTITVHLEHGGSKVLVRGVMDKFAVDLYREPFRISDTTEEGILGNVRAMVTLSEAKDFSVNYTRKLDEEE